MLTTVDSKADCNVGAPLAYIQWRSAHILLSTRDHEGEFTHVWIHNTHTADAVPTAQLRSLLRDMPSIPGRISIAAECWRGVYCTSGMELRHVPVGPLPHTQDVPLE